MVGAGITESTASVLIDSEVTSIQGLRAPRAHIWMGTARGAIVGKHTAAQRHSPPDPFNADGVCVCLIALGGSSDVLRLCPYAGGGCKSLILSQMGALDCLASDGA